MQRTIGIVGAGTIGASWALAFLEHGHEVVVCDPSEAARLAVAALAEARSLGHRLLLVNDVTGLGGVDFVQESGPEREDRKIELFLALEAVIAPDVVIASSSSGLLISNIQRHCTRPDRCLIGHPFNPPHLIPLVEVVRGASTSDGAIEVAMQLYEALGKRPILINKEVIGHVANRLQAAVLREAIHLLLAEVASAEDIEKAMVYGPGMRWAAMGPLLTFHLGGGAGGIDAFFAHLGGPIQTWWSDLGTPNLTADAIARVVTATEAMVADRSMPDLIARRDDFLTHLNDIQPSFYGPREN